MEAGLDPDSFWNQTPRTLDAILDGYVQRRKIENDQAVSLAWHIEAFRRSGKQFPSLAKALGRQSKPASTKQSNDEIMSAMRTWAAVQNKAAKKQSQEA